MLSREFLVQEKQISHNALAFLEEMDKGVCSFFFCCCPGKFQKLKIMLESNPLSLRPFFPMQDPHNAILAGKLGSRGSFPKCPELEGVYMQPSQEKVERKGRGKGEGLK